MKIVYILQVTNIRNIVDEYRVEFHEFYPFFVNTHKACEVRRRGPCKNTVISHSVLR